MVSTNIPVNKIEQKEADLTKKVLWSVVKAAGGKIAVPYNVWDGIDRTVVLYFTDNPATHEIIIEAVDDGSEQKEI